MDYNQFALEAQRFADWTSTLHDADACWLWRTHATSLSSPPGYLTKATRLFVASQRAASSEQVTSSDEIEQATGKEQISSSEQVTGKEQISSKPDSEEIEQMADEAEYRAASSRPACHSFELHVVYSSAYQVPVFYFNGYDDSGSPLGAADITACLRPPSGVWQAQRAKELWPMLSQEEHPVLGVPFYFLHPCATAALLGQLRGDRSSDDGSYLVSWLSVYAPLVGLHARLPTIQSTQQQ